MSSYTLNNSAFLTMSLQGLLFFFFFLNFSDLDWQIFFFGGGVGGGGFRNEPEH